MCGERAPKPPPASVIVRRRDDAVAVMASVDPPDGHVNRVIEGGSVHLCLQPVSDQLRVTDNIVPAIVIVRITVEDAANLVLDHLQCLALVGHERTPVLAVSHRGLERLCDARMFGKVTVAGSTLGKCRGEVRGSVHPSELPHQYPESTDQQRQHQEAHGYQCRQGWSRRFACGDWRKPFRERQSSLAPNYNAYVAHVR